MRLEEYINLIKDEGLDITVSIPGFEGKDAPAEALCREITGLSCDSRTVSPGTLFVCKGAAFKPEYLAAAIEKGAAAYVAGPDIRRAMAVLANAFYGQPWKDLKLVGITGTKGKTTALYYLKSIMEGSAACGERRFGYLSTIDTYDGVELFESHLTTPEAIELGQRLYNMKNSGIRAAAIEVSSQALKYDRTLGVRFKIGEWPARPVIFLNYNHYWDGVLKFMKQMVKDKAVRPNQVSFVGSIRSPKNLFKEIARVKKQMAEYA